MMKNRYSISWVAGGFLLALVVFIAIIMFFASPNVAATNIWKWIVVIGFFVAALDFKFGIYVYIEDGYIYRVQEFIVRRKIKISDIQGIYYAPTFIIGKINRSIYIVADPKDRRKMIEMSNTGYDRRTLAKVVKDLKGINSSIKLDEHTEKLLNESA